MEDSDAALAALALFSSLYCAAMGTLYFLHGVWCLLTRRGKR